MPPLAVSYFLLLFIFIVAVLAVAVAIVKKIDAYAKSTVRLLFIVPQGLINPLQEHRQSEIELSQELYRRLGELRIPFTVEAEVPGVGEEINFFISVPRAARKKIARLMETFWRSGSLTDANDFDSWHAGLATSFFHIGYLTQQRPYSVPIELARRGHFEPFMDVLRLLSTLAPLGEGAAIQYVVYPADPRLAEDIGKLLNNLERGAYHISKHLHETFVITPDTLQAIKQKVRQPLFLVNARLAASSSTELKAKKIIKEAAHLLAGDPHTNNNQLALAEVKNPEKIHAEFLHQRFAPSQTIVLSAQELATLFHFPGPTTPIPKIRRH